MNIYAEPTSGMDAVEVLAQHEAEIYLVLLDLKMPTLDGLGVMKHLVNVHTYPVGIIMITGWGTLEVVRDFYSVANDTVVASGFVQKPFGRGELLQNIEDTLDRIHLKRVRQVELSTGDVHSQLVKIDTRITRIVERLPETRDALDKLMQTRKTLLEELGMELLKAIVIAIAVIAFMYFGFDDVISAIIHNAP